MTLVSTGLTFSCKKTCGNILYLWQKICPYFFLLLHFYLLTFQIQAFISQGKVFKFLQRKKRVSFCESNLKKKKSPFSIMKVSSEVKKGEQWTDSNVA